MQQQITTSFQKQFGLVHPLVLAPMGAAAGGELAAAVSNAGGLGLVGGSYGDADWLKRELDLVTQLTERPWGVGLVMFTVQHNMHLLDLVLSYRPAVIELSFGNPRLFADKIKAAGVKLIVQVHNVEQAILARDAGADAVIAQGVEAGGHGLSRATLPLVPAVVDAVGADIPVLAAGGIADGRGVAAALMLGASGVMMGTRFYATSECLAHLKAKHRVVNTTAEQLVRTRAYDIVRGIDWPANYKGRAIFNDFAATWVGREGELPQAPDSVREEYALAVQEDDLRLKAVFCGEVADLVQDIVPAGELVERIMDETVLHLNRASQLLTTTIQA